MSSFLAWLSTTLAWTGPAGRPVVAAAGTAPTTSSADVGRRNDGSAEADADEAGYLAFLVGPVPF